MELKRKLNDFFFVSFFFPEKFANNFNALQSKIPKYSLRKAIYNLSASPECFYALRNNFAKSLAAMNIAHWVLGIGDRHLDNFVMDKRNAQLIGIDFNMVRAMRQQLF